MPYKVFAEDIAAPLSHMVFYTLASQSKKVEKIIGRPVKSPLQEITNSKVKWCLEEKNILEQEKKILKKLENPDFYKKVIKESYSSLKKFKKASKKVLKADYSSLSLNEIAKLLSSFFKIWIEASLWGHIINISDFHFGFLSKKIILIIEKRIAKTKAKIPLAQTFALLTTPTKRSMVVQQEIDLLEILKEIQKNKKFKKTKQFKRKIKQHKEKYDWLRYGYIGPTILDEKYFIEILSNLQKQKIKAEKKIKEIMAREKQTRKKQAQIKKLLKLTAKELYWINMACNFTYLKGLRKEITFIASRALHPLFLEIGKRFNLSLKQVYQMTIDEIFQALKKRKVPSLDILNERAKYCIVYYPKGKERVYIKKQAKKLAKKIVIEKFKEEIREIKGSPAYPGKAKGKAKLIFKVEDIKKMKKGDILVSPATNPNVMPAIVKAKAIVTDEGGITCHAAIVSRELKIPCLVGTKIATKVLQDGDLVEVDANKGIVRKLG